MISINLSIDFGGSGIKAIASTEDNIYAFRIAPEIIEMTGEPPKLNGAFEIDLSQNMWVGFGVERYAVGLLARMEYLASIPLVAPKLDYVVPRTLAAVAVAMVKFGVTKCEVNLQLLFPSAEFERTDTSALIRSLKAALSLFDTPIGQLKAKLKAVDVVPEGFGLTKRFMSIGASYNNHQIACIMFGHRNTSLYLCVGGQPKHYRSNNKGFVRAIEYAKLDPLQGLHNPERVDQQSIDKYWLANKSWLIENLPLTTSIAVVGGGPVAVIADEIQSFLMDVLPALPVSGKIPVSFNGGMPITSTGQGRWKEDIEESDLLQCWPKSIDIPESDRRQFCDVYCLWATNEMTKRAAILA
jgi:hypothetical protein